MRNSRWILPVWFGTLPGLFLAWCPSTRADEAPPAAQPAPAAVSEAAIRQHVEYLASPALEGRGDERGKKLASAYIVDQLEQSGLKPLFGDAYFQSIPGLPTGSGQATIAGRNVGGWIEGTDPALRNEYIIISAHYDHLGIRNGRLYPGADDNASAVAMVLEAARLLQLDRPLRSVAVVSFDLEEQMLWGSRWFVAHPPWPLKQVKLFITADLIGRSLGNLPLNNIFAIGAEHADGLKPIVNAAQRPGTVEIQHLGVDLVGTRSDYGPFRDEKIPFLFFSSGEHPDYHTPDDTPDRIDYAKVADVTSIVHDVCRAAGNLETTPEWTDHPRRDLDEVRVLQKITEALLAADNAAQSDGKGRLNNLQRFLVSNVHVKTRQIIQRGTVTEDERPWLIRASQALLLAVF